MGWYMQNAKLPTYNLYKKKLAFKNGGESSNKVYN